ncbi:MAG TPA: hypothetical protein VFG59_01340 [Anaeromyxobacter sp.]|nr:hypothetical protein [Anaeromyxobacter sp.]
MSELPREAEFFLRDLERCLSTLPEGERRDIVAEIRSHLVDRAGQGATELLRSFGTAEAYAAAFLEERALTRALAARSSWGLCRALLRGARRLGWWYAVAALGLVQLLGVVLLGLAVAKLFLPERVGLFVGGSSLTLGMRDEGTTGTEVLGLWAVPLFFAIGFLALWSARFLLRLLASWRLSRVRPRLAP